MSIILCKPCYVNHRNQACQILTAAIWAAAPGLQNQGAGKLGVAARKLAHWKILEINSQLANCTKNPGAGSENFGILPIVKSIDKIKNL